MLEEVPAQSLFLAVNLLLLCVLGTDEVKQKTSLFSVQGKICLELFYGFCSFFFTSSVSGSIHFLHGPVMHSIECLLNYFKAFQI